MHGLVEELESLDVLDGTECRLGVLEDDERLALRLQVGLGDNINNLSIFGEDGMQRFLERLGLNALLEVANIDTGKKYDAVSLNRSRLPRFSQDMLVRVGVQ